LKALITDTEIIKHLATEREEENDAFRSYLQNKYGNELDETVQMLSEIITPQIDCTACGACCRKLMINVTPEETILAADHLNISQPEFKEKYIEESLEGKMVINTIPCHFLADKKCTIYRERFNECREFPHLHKSNFKGRLFGTLVHYAMCPIIFNVVEALKIETEFLKGNKK
jgi:uncharacterized protein